MNSLSSAVVWNPPKSKSKYFIGFDGFTDHLLQAVDQRHNAEQAAPFTCIEDFGKRILSAAGKSTNIELLHRQTKLGGNAPILAHALGKLGNQVTLAGMIGSPGKIEAPFAELGQSCCSLIPLGPSGRSDAIEFSDGKVIFGQHQAILAPSAKDIFLSIGKDEWIRLLQDSQLFAAVNWTMLPWMTELWKIIIEEILPHIDRNPLRYLFIDLADPVKRSRRDLVQALKVLESFQSHFSVVLACNESEAQHILKFLDCPKNRTLCQDLHSCLPFSHIVVHSQKDASISCQEGSFQLSSPFCRHPHLSTGAGDHFNAGFCHALLLGAQADVCLAYGMACAGFYIRQGKSPNLKELQEFLGNWNKNPDQLDQLYLIGDQYEYTS